MMRTFLIYNMVDKCIDLLFDRIESIFVPNVGLRVGDCYKKIVLRQKMPISLSAYSITDRVFEYHDCVIDAFHSDAVWLKVRLLQNTYIFDGVAGANAFMSLHAHRGFDVSDDGCEVSFVTYLSTAVAITTEMFHLAEKYT